ncbi:MAG: AraC family transcriptional regulator [Verrucomicrobia bacterium]|nr:AraC family transcriptional regulator [Verrucomicrobiota bacterium]
MPVRPFRDLLWTRLDARAGSTAVLRLELHRHLPETAKLGAHFHAHWQALLYLSGHGVQQIGRSIHPVSSGSLVILPPGSRHAFRRAAGQPPLCLMLDFRAPWQKRVAVRALAAVEIARVRSVLADMARLNDDKRMPDQIGRAALSLRLLAQIAEASGWYPRSVRHSALTVLHRVQKLLENDTRPKAVASALGYHPDYLSRLVRAETGLGLSGLASQVRLQHAQKLLREHAFVRDAAAEAGFLDQNYFARWFKKQTGQTPLEWKAGRPPMSAQNL